MVLGTTIPKAPASFPSVALNILDLMSRCLPFIWKKKNYSWLRHHGNTENCELIS